jgi:preprotein translocase subunit SecF
MKTELNDYEVVVTTEYLSNENQVSDVLKSLYNDSYKINKIESIGPKIGKELSKNARNAIIASLILIGLYISIRFDFSYAVGSIAALLHDLIITLGVFVVVDYEISVAIIAALLTIVGYSLNDTIVIYDRIRENLTNNPHRIKDQTINESLNQTLARTIVTSLTTLLVVMVLFLYGGNVLKPFAFTLIVGVLLGTYSSLFVASPIMLYLEEKFNLEVEEKENI